MKIDVWVVPEIQLAWTPLIQETIQKVHQKAFGNFKAIGTSSSEGTIGHKQPRGVCLLSQGDNAGWIALTGTNSRGLCRWSYAVFNGRYNKRTWIIAEYCVSPNTTTGKQT
eukprot:4418788-Ditylum_brightwellii.AAC.1